MGHLAAQRRRLFGTVLDGTGDLFNLADKGAYAVGTMIGHVTRTVGGVARTLTQVADMAYRRRQLFQ